MTGLTDIPTFTETRRKAMREKTTITAHVLMANDTICLIQFGPRGGWRYKKKDVTRKLWTRKA